MLGGVPCLTVPKPSTAVAHGLVAPLVDGGAGTVRLTRYRGKVVRGGRTVAMRSR